MRASVFCVLMLLASQAWAGNIAGLVKICDKSGSCPTGSVATAAGELLVEGDAEVDGNANVAGTMTVSGAATLGSTLTITGVLAPSGGVAPSPMFTATFNEGADKGLFTMQPDYTASDRTEVGTTLISLTNWGVYGGHTFGYVALADTGQTIDITTVAGGLDLSGDDTDNDGYELFWGMPGLSGGPAIIGTTAAFSACASITVTDVSVTDDLQWGVRRAEPVRAAFDDYLDAATLGINASAATAAIKIETIDDNGATTSTDTTDTWADGATKALCVLVSGAGVVTYTINGAAPTVTAAFTIDDGDPVVPFFRYLHASSAAIGVTLVSVTVSYQ